MYCDLVDKTNVPLPNDVDISIIEEEDDNLKIEEESKAVSKRKQNNWCKNLKSVLCFKVSTAKNIETKFENKSLVPESSMKSSNIDITTGDETQP